MKTSEAEPCHLTVLNNRTQLPLTKTAIAPFHLAFYTTDHQHAHGPTMGQGKRKRPFTKTHQKRPPLGPTRHKNYTKSRRTTIGTTHILHAKFQRPTEEIEGLGMKNRCEEEGLGNGPHRDQPMASQGRPFSEAFQLS
jgi:hypothetical protein